MISFGITGGIASGKSFVSETIRKYDIPIVDADLIARQFVSPGEPTLDKIVGIFGNNILDKNGSLKRGALGKIVFSDPESKTKLDNIMRPLIEAEAEIQIKKLHKLGHNVVGFDSALLIEFGMQYRYRPLIVVSLPYDIQLKRLMTRNGFTKEEAKLRIKSQLPLDQKVSLADYVIDNSGSPSNTVKQVIAHLAKIKNL